MSNAWWRATILLVGVVPLLTQLPYLFHAWTTSRLDRWDWVFMLAAWGAGALAWPRLRPMLAPIHAPAALGAALGVLLYAVGFRWSIHAVGIIGAMVFFWGMAAVALGRRIAVATLPFLALLTLSCSSTTGWLSAWSGGNGLLLKVIFAVPLLLLQIFPPQFIRNVSRQTMLFAAGLLLLAVLYFISDFRYELFMPFHIAADRYQSGAFIGRRLAPTELDRRFFGQSDVHRALYADAESTIAVLKISNFDNVHKIHPVGHCLRSAGRNVVSETLRTLLLPGGKLQVQELVTDNRDGTFTLIWAWYGNEKNSSGNFLFFRKLYDPAQAWSAWQIATTTPDAEMTAARKRLESFLIRFQAR